jgi:hypothetical protein
MEAIGKLGLLFASHLMRFRWRCNWLLPDIRKNLADAYALFADKPRGQMTGYASGPCEIRIGTATQANRTVRFALIDLLALASSDRLSA